MIAITPESILGLAITRGFGWSLRVPKRFCHPKRCGTLSLCFKICTVKLFEKMLNSTEAETGKTVLKKEDPTGGV